jgi:hypothetical protein
MTRSLLEQIAENATEQREDRSLLEDASDARIRRRLGQARAALDVALDDLKAVMRRVDKHRARIGRLESVLAIPAEVRRERARKAVATRQRPPAHRQRRYNRVAE